MPNGRVITAVSAMKDRMVTSNACVETASPGLIVPTDTTLAPAIPVITTDDVDFAQVITDQSAIVAGGKKTGRQLTIIAIAT